MRLLSVKPDESSPAQEGILRSDWPARLDKNHAVQIEQRPKECVLTLHEWAGERIGKEIGRVVMPDVERESAGVFAGLLVFKTRENTIYAFCANNPQGQWKPAWTFDILLKPPAQAKNRVFYYPTMLAVKDGLLWLATSDRLAALDEAGRAHFDVAFANPLGAAKDARLSTQKLDLGIDNKVTFAIDNHNGCDMVAI
jgi:hypothetical protein